jgi:hypothetical protein
MIALEAKSGIVTLDIKAITHLTAVSSSVVLEVEQGGL